MAKYRLGWHKDSYLGYANNLDDVRKLAIKIWKDNPTAQYHLDGITIFVGKDRYGYVFCTDPSHPKFHKDYTYYGLTEFDPRTGKLLGPYSYQTAKPKRKR